MKQRVLCLVETAFVFGVTQHRSTVYKEKAREGLLLFLFYQQIEVCD